MLKLQLMQKVKSLSWTLFSFVQIDEMTPVDVLTIDLHGIKYMHMLLDINEW